MLEHLRALRRSNHAAVPAVGVKSVIDDVSGADVPGDPRGVRLKFQKRS